MLKRLAAPASCSSCLLAFLLAFVSPRCTLSIGADKTMVNKEDYYSATVNATVLDHKGNPQQMVTKNDGRYGQNSPKIEAKGIVIAPATVNGAVDLQGCCPHTRFIVPPKTTHWVAIMQRGKCTFKEKILKAAAFNASAVIIYNNSTKEDTVTMAHEGTGDIVAVMITESFGKEILGFLEKNQTVLVSVMETEPDFNHCAVCIEGYQLNDVVRILPCKHVFHKMCVDPWLNEHCTCPMCKLNILKALGVMPNLPCVDNMAFDMDRMSRSQTSSQRTALVDLSSETSISLEPLRHSSSSQLPSDEELIPRTGEINIAVTSGHFFNRNSVSPRSVVCEMELPDIQASLDMYDDNKS
ncbi:E3 ubiquitin-protein ligase RNF130-like protein [Labeo rohita]|uniref:E3 ubiquitin-protein ligase RNF130-like protein n=1 Tax=Labeo rohita TaxID=84645 RepID=A0A498LGT0_LABRO|nr:E3 ubiquitin-protein ligase RNF130-like protein [Labeo rohita]